ncbi:MAG: nucleotide-binding universal stress UspA family protein [Planctomycetota bacterium]|jgi:nucleotide-binding universal stress UspA family protein
MNVKHILLTTDLSEESKRSFGPVATLAKATGAKVTLLHVSQILSDPGIGGHMGTTSAPPDYDAELRNAEQAMAEFTKSLPAGLEVSAKVLASANVAETVGLYAEEHDTDLIALSTHGRSGIKRLLLGSVAEGVLRHTHIPVVCFPPQDHGGVDEPAPIKHILLTTDLSEEAMRSFQPVLEFAKGIGAKVSVLHVVHALLAIPHGAPLAPPVTSPDLSREVAKAQSSIEDQCSSLRADSDLSVHVISHKTPINAIGEFAEKHAVDLVAISTHGRSGFRRLALGSFAEQVIRLSSVPVLSFHRTK